MPSLATSTVEIIADTALILRTVPFTAAGSVTVGTWFPSDASGGAFTVTLPVAGQQEGSRVLIFKKTDSSVNAVTISRQGSDLIDGATTYVLSAQYNGVILIDDEAGGNWHVLGTI